VAKKNLHWLRFPGLRGKGPDEGQPSFGSGGLPGGVDSLGRMEAGDVLEDRPLVPRHARPTELFSRVPAAFMA